MINKRTSEEIEIIFDFLKIDFEQGDEAADDTSKAHELVDMILWRERVRHGAEAVPEIWSHLDMQTLNTMLSWDTEEYELLLSMIVLRKLANGEGGSAIRTLKNAITNKAQTLSKLQSEKAKKSRPNNKNPLTLLVEQFVHVDPDINNGKLKSRLLNHIRSTPNPTCQVDFSKEVFIPKDGNFPPVSFKNLPKYLSRAKSKTLPG